MKTLKYFLAVFVGIALFVACEKEFSLESGYAGMVAKGSLLDTSGNCKGIAVNGSYFTDSTLSDSNYIVVQVNIDSGGSYRIFTDTQNGFSFQDSGFIAAGVHNIKLKASGKPLSSRQTLFQVAFDTSFCSFTVSVTDNRPATYTLVSASGACTGATPNGSYASGTALNAGNTVSLAVNVTAIGNYSIRTSAVNGISFSGSGSFSTLGPQIITLQGSGTPTNTGSFTFPVTAGSSNCSFPITVTTGNPANIDPNFSDSAWSFVQGANSFRGPFFDVFDTTITNTYGLIFIGFTPTTADTLLYFGAFFPGSTIQPGTYSTNSFAAFEYTDRRDTANVKTIYSANFQTAGATTQITISSYDPATKIITGTFSGTAMNASNAPVPITNGKFRARVR